MNEERIRLVLPPAEEPGRRLLEELAEALRNARPETAVETVELLGLPSFGRMDAGPTLVIADRPLALPRGAVGLGVVPRWAVDPHWTRSQAQLHAVAHPALIEALARLGQPASRIAAPGLTLGSLAAGTPPAADEARQRLGLGPDRTVLAVLIEGLEASQLEPLLFQLTLLDPPVRLVFFSGNDTGQKELLRRRVPALGLDARLLPDARHLPDLLSATELALVCAEGVPSSAALAAGLPTLVVASGRPGGEADPRILAELGLARPVTELRSLAAEIDLLRGDGQARDRLRRRLAEAGLPADPLPAWLSLVQRAFDERQQLLLGPPVEAASPAHPAAGEQATAVAAPGPSVLESLGPPAPVTPPPGDRRSLLGEQAGPGREATLRTLTDAVTAERSARARLTELEAELERWRRRAALAAQAGDPELQELAAAEIGRLEPLRLQLVAELERLAAFRLQAQRGTPAAPEEAEARFRRLELDAELRALKRRLEE